MMRERKDLDSKYVGGVFDRQVRIQDWDQKALEEQTALVLGAGGLGSQISIGLLRLGIKKLFIVDYDVVDVHNLNRQLLYSLADVGCRKVEAAVKHLAFHNINHTEIISFDGDALKNWKTICKFAEESNIIFNCIDYGDKFDAAVSSLCVKLKLPLIMGGTFATTFTIDYLQGRGKPCFLCTNDEESRQKEVMSRISPDHILELEDLSFMKKNNNPISRSSTVVCSLCGNFMLSEYLNILFLSQNKPFKANRLICYHNTFQSFNFALGREAKCLFCGDPNYVQPDPNDLTDLI